MASELFLSMLKKYGGYREGHFKLRSGQHSNVYLDKRVLFPYPKALHMLGNALALHFEALSPEVVVGPEQGGAKLSQWVAWSLPSSNDGARAIDAEKVPGGNLFTIRPQFTHLLTGKRVLIVEDILTTGGTVKKVVDLVRQIGGNVIGVGALCNRGGVSAAALGDVPKLKCLATIEAAQWDASACPLCQQQVPIDTNFGAG